MRTLVLFSGGLKAAFLATLAGKEGEVLLLFFDYGQENLAREKEAVLRFASSTNFPVLIHELKDCPPFEETLFRFLYFIFHALPHAKAGRCKQIYYGLSRDEEPRTQLFDPFIDTLQGLLLAAQAFYDGKGFWLYPMEIETPLRKLYGAHVVQLGNEWGIEWKLTWSCEHGMKTVCGMCKHCKRRRNAFAKTDTLDPII